MMRLVAPIRVLYNALRGGAPFVRVGSRVAQGNANGLIWKIHRGRSGPWPGISCGCSIRGLRRHRALGRGILAVCREGFPALRGWLDPDRRAGREAASLPPPMAA